MDWTALTQTQPFLGLIPPQLRKTAETLEVAAGTPLFRMGDRVGNAFSIISGEVRLLRNSRSGAEIILQRVRAGFFAEASMYSKSYHCNAVAASAALVLRFPLSSFRAALDQDASFRNAWMIHLTREVRNLRSRNERLSLHSAADRIVHCIEAEGSEGVLLLDQSRKAWARELGLSHEALYRALSRLETDGTLDIDGNRIALAQSRLGRNM